MKVGLFIRNIFLRNGFTDKLLMIMAFSPITTTWFILLTSANPCTALFPECLMHIHMARTSMKKALTWCTRCAVTWEIHFSSLRFIIICSIVNILMSQQIIAAMILLLHRD